MKKFLESKLSIFFILLLAFILRLIVINQSLWLDEAIGAIAVKNFTYKSIIYDFLTSDNHPPLYYFILKAWTGVFGYSEVSIRMPSVLFATATVYLTYLIAGIVSKKKSFQILVLFLMTISPFHIYYSQEARMYPLTAFFSGLAVFFFLKIINSKKSSLIFWVGFSLAITLLVFTDYLPVLLLPVFWIYGLVFKKERLFLSKLFLTHLLLVFVGIWWLPIFLIQSESGKWLLQTLPAWKILAGGASFKQIALLWMKFVGGRISFFPKWLYYLLVVISSFGYVFVITTAVRETLKSFKGKKKIIDNNLVVLILWLLVPLILGLLLSFIIPAFIYFRYLYIYPAFVLLISWGTTIIEKRTIKNLVVSFLVTSSLVGLAVYYLDENQHREKWRQAVFYVENNAQRQDVAIFEFPQPFAPYRWYATGKIESRGATDSISANEKETIAITKNAITNRKGIYYFNYLQDLSDPNGYVLEVIKNQGFKEIDSRSFIGVGKVTYYRKDEI